MKRILLPLLLGAAAATALPAVADSITFYESDNFRGRQFSADRAVPNFARDGNNDRFQSAVVHDGRWEICVDADFAGSCGVLAPGAYPDLGAYAGRVSSVRPIDARYTGNRVDDRVVVGSRGDDRRIDDRSRSGAGRATLYEGSNYSGRSFALGETMPNLGNTGFNDRASSLRVDSGYWIFCSDSDFRGECRTFGPGDYASLPELSNTISSGRRIANAYPYLDRPTWQRDPGPQGYNPRR
ncbi:MAG: beta/gamma crystallin-related protein [Betaproteobacteria bacterium]